MKVKDLIAEASSLPLEERAMLADSILKTLRSPQTIAKRTLRDHPAFGRWRDKQVDGLAYQHDQRKEWPL